MVIVTKGGNTTTHAVLLTSIDDKNIVMRNSYPQLPTIEVPVRRRTGNQDYIIKNWHTFDKALGMRRPIINRKFRDIQPDMIGPSYIGLSGAYMVEDKGYFIKFNRKGDKTGVAANQKFNQ